MNAVSLDEANRRIDRLLNIQRRIGAERDMNVLPGVVMQEVAQLLDADRISLFLLDRDTMSLRAVFAEGVAASALVVPLRMGIVGSAILTRETCNVTNAYGHPHFNHEIDALSGYKTHSLLVAPMQAADGRVVGGVELLNKASGRFTETDERSIESVAAVLADRAAAGTLEGVVAGTELAALRRRVDCDRGTVFVVDEPGGRLRALYAEGSDEALLALSVKLGIAGLVAVTKKTLVIPDAWADSRFDASYDKRTGYHTRNILCVPLVNPAGEALGVIQAINKNRGLFNEEDRRTLESIAGIVAIAFENAMLLADHDRQFHSLVEVLAASIDAKDALTAGHSHRVADIAVAIGAALGFTEADLDVLRVAALLHDYGKIGIDDSVLKKEGKLTAEEYAHMQRHAALTFDILDKIHFARKYGDVPVVASSHHERLDGAGYPRGLMAQEIPFLAKILAVADVFEALTADRHYRRGMDEDRALAIIDEGCGDKFDPHVVAALKRHLGKAAHEQA